MKETLFTDYPDYYEILYQKRDAEGQTQFVLDNFEHAGRRDTNRALILGCGTGSHSPHFCTAGFDVVGIDKHEPMLDVARERSDATFRSGTLPDVALDGHFDVVFLPGNVVNYLTAEEFAETIALVDDHLSETGVLVFDYSVIFDVGAQAPPFLHVGSDGVVDVAQLVQLRRISEERTLWNALVFGIEPDNYEIFIDTKEFFVHDTERIRSVLAEKGYDVEVYPDGYGTGDPLERVWEVVVAS